MLDKIKALFKKDMYQNDLRQHYKNTFDTVSGRIVLEDLMKFGHVNNITFRPGDPHETSFNEGMRRVALHILAYSQADLINQPNQQEETNA